MSSLALMEWIAKPPSQWEWDNLISFGVKGAENPKKLHSEGWGIDVLGGEDSGSFYSLGFGAGGSGGSGSDLGYTSSHRSSKSASVGSPFVGEMRTSKISFESEDGILEEFPNAKEYYKVERTDTSPTLEASVGSGEPLLSLKLGKRTYFEDASGRSSAKSTSFSVTPVPPLAPSKRSKSNYLSTSPPRCQVEGCNLDLSSAKDYHRKHRVCENHSKSPKVIVGGLELRFCQQCSRFHGLSEFDENKRSCRKRLFNHNARRRKPQSESMQLNSASLPSSFSDGRQQMNINWNKIPLFNSKPAANMMWSSKLMQSEGYTVKPVKTESLDGQLNMPTNGLQNINDTVYHNSNGIFSSTGAMEVLNQGLLAIPSNMDTTQDLHRALSLLSTGPVSSSESKPISLDQTTCENASSMPQPTVHTITQSFPAALPDYWQNQRTEPQAAADMASHNYCNNFFQEFQQSSVPYEGETTAFYSSQFD